MIKLLVCALLIAGSVMYGGYGPLGPDPIIVIVDSK